MQKGGPETHHTPCSLPPRAAQTVFGMVPVRGVLLGNSFFLFSFFFLLSLSFLVLFWGQKLFPNRSDVALSEGGQRSHR